MTQTIMNLESTNVKKNKHTIDWDKIQPSSNDWCEKKKKKERLKSRIVTGSLKGAILYGMVFTDGEVTGALLYRNVYTTIDGMPIVERVYRTIDILPVEDSSLSERCELEELGISNIYLRDTMTDEQPSDMLLDVISNILKTDIPSLKAL